MKQFRSPFNQRQYMLSDDFEIFYYSDTDFKSVDLHSHDYYEFYFFIEGNVRMEIDGREYPVEPGEMVLIPPGIMHRALVSKSVTSPYRRIVFWISKRCCESLIAQSDDHAYIFRLQKNESRYRYRFDGFEANEIRSKLFALIDETRSDRWGRDTAISLCLGELMLTISRIVHHHEEAIPGDSGKSWYELITNYIYEHLSDDLSLDVISRDLYVNKYYISHVFQETTGMSVHQYIIKRRLAACCEAILEGERATEICMQFGFKDYSSFYRAFKKEYGKSPAEYVRDNKR